MPSTITDRVNGVSTSVAVKAPVAAATTANITLSGTQTIDGVAVVAGNRVLVKNQTNSAENGIYDVDTLTWSRSEDMDGNDDLVEGTTVYVNAGTVNGDNWFNASLSASPPVMGTTQITWSQTYVSFTPVTVSPASETVAGIVELATQAETTTGTDDARAVTPLKLATYVAAQPTAIGKHMIPIMAGAMIPATTNGAAQATVESTTNKVMYKTLDFDATTQEFAGFSIPWPKSSNEGTISFQVIWTATGGTNGDGVVWALEAVGSGDLDAVDTAFGTAVQVTDLKASNGSILISSESGAVTIRNLAEGDLVFFRVKRVPSDASDVLAVDARLLGVKLYITINALNDA